MSDDDNDAALLTALLRTSGGGSDVERAERLLSSTSLPDHQRLILERFLEKMRGIPVIPLE